MLSAMAATICLASACQPEPAPGRVRLARQSAAATIPCTFEADDGYVFDAIIARPPPRLANGYGVLLIGGGFGNDLDWTVPPGYAINGQSHREAVMLTSALVEAGFTVMRWSTIRHGDPLASDWPRQATTYPFPVALSHARSALARFRREQLVADDRYILLGQDLGAWRACGLADGDRGVVGLVLLSGSRLARTGPNDGDGVEVKQRASDLRSAMDTDGDGRLDTVEFRTWQRVNESKPLAQQSFGRLDFDGDRLLANWELAAALAMIQRTTMHIPDDCPTDRYGLAWAEDVIVQRDIAALVLYGSLDDAQALYGPILKERARRSGLGNVQIQVFSKLGHNLGRQAGYKLGPISDDVVDTITRWLEKQFCVDGGDTPCQPDAARRVFR